MAVRKNANGLSRGTLAQFNRAAKRLRALSVAVREEFREGLYLVGEEIMADIKDSRPGKGVPVDMGDLSRSGRVERPEPHAVTLSFGGSSAPYALIQHEGLDFNHTVGEARYLVRGVERWDPKNSGAHGEAVKRANDRARGIGRGQED